METPSPLDRVAFLASSAGCDLRALAAATRQLPAHQRVTRLRKDADAPQVAWILECDELERRAYAKLPADARPSIERMIFEQTALEQATAWEVAVHRAEQWPLDATPIHDLCGGLGIDAWAAAMRGHHVHIYESHAERAAMLRHNIAAWELSSRIDVHEGDCRDEAPFREYVFFDPDRRGDGNHDRRSPTYEPPIESWDLLLSAAKAAMVKLPFVGETDDVCASVKNASHVEWVSLHGRARERRAYLGTWSHTAPRRATLLPEGTFVEGPVTEMPEAILPVEGAFLYDPDVSVIRADLVGCAAKQHGLHALNRELPYLLAKEPVQPLPGHWVRIDAKMPLNVKRIRQWLRTQRVGPLTIRKRGVKDAVDKWRKRFPTSGKVPATLVLTCLPDDKWIVLAGLD